MARTILIMAGGTGGHVFGCGRALRLTGGERRLAFTENVTRNRSVESGLWRGRF